MYRCAWMQASCQLHWLEAIVSRPLALVVDTVRPRSQKEVRTINMAFQRRRYSIHPAQRALRVCPCSHLVLILFANVRSPFAATEPHLPKAESRTSHCPSSTPLLRPCRRHSSYSSYLRGSVSLLRVRVSFACLLTGGLHPAAVHDGKDMARAPS